MKKILSLVALSLALNCLNIAAQDTASSTVINPDGTVTFNYTNPKAREVQVDVQFAGRHNMQRNGDKGQWSLTLGPAAPDMYPYCFVIDGVSIMDPENPQYFPNEGFKNSILDIPGKDSPLIHSIQDVPHGTVDYIKYYSEAIKGYNNAIVYTPPTYSKSDKKYPVFYLISGTTDTEEVYYKVGRMNYILDNLIAQGQAKEMIIVLPYGNPSKLMGTNGGFSMQDFFGKDLTEDLMPYVESHYRTINDRDHRAIGGFSRGGNQGLMNGLVHLDKFSYLCSYSSFTMTNLPNVYDNAEETNSKIHLFWAGVGTDDFLYGTSRDYTEFLDQKGIRCVKEYTTDKFGHTWMNAKYFLDKTLRLLFNEEASAEAMKNAQPTKEKTGQEQQFTPGVMARLFPKQVVSPEINGNDVTFRIKAENAKQVQLVGEMVKKAQPMVKDEDGVWSITLKQLPQDVFCYNFIVDGTEVADAQNMYLEPALGFKRSILDLTAKTEAQIEYSPVKYYTDRLGMRFAKICPKGYEKVELPGIVLDCGKNGTVESWHKIAKANEILDQMVAAGQCKPCALLLFEDKADSPDTMPHINADKFRTWGEARQALIKALKNL